MVINSFKGEYRFLSNFYPCFINYEGLNFNTVEHAYVAAKTLDFEERKFISNIETAGKVKKYGRSVDLRRDWDLVKLKIMEELVYKKFTGSYRLSQLLISTGESHIEEGNYWGDTYWGVCNGEGQNKLGLILMKVRSSIMQNLI